MKKVLKILVTIMVAWMLTGCMHLGNMETVSEVKPAKDDKKTVTVTTSFLQDMVSQLAGDYINIEVIIPIGSDPHQYVAKPQDLLKISNADLILYQGLHFEGKLAQPLEVLGSGITKDIPMSDLILEGGTADPHYWFDIDLYKRSVATTADELIELIPEYAADIQSNEDEYQAQLDQLDAYNRQAISQIKPENRYLVTPHDAFAYFSRAYNFDVYAPQGINTQTEVSNQDIEATANFIVSHQIPALFVESTSNPVQMAKIQEAVAAEGYHVEVVTGENKQLLTDSLSSKGQTGDSYISMYKHNIDLIVEHLK